MRDDFKRKTREKLAQRAGYRCSKPDCRRPTRGAASDNERTIDLGEAAHITAASPGGPRFDAALSSDDRASLANGIWLCTTHAKLVDSDQAQFTVEAMRSWKKDAEAASFEAMSSGTIRVEHSVSGVDDLTTALEVIRTRAKADLATFQKTLAWPSHPITLHLKLVSREGSQTFGVDGLAAAIGTFDAIAVIAEPGTGKTTTLLQLAASALEQPSFAAVYVPLSEWSTRTDSFIDSVARRRSFKGISADHLAVVAEHGRLLLILDGWNELDDGARKRANGDIEALRRDFPDIHLVISSRFKELELPVDGPIVNLALLNREQQREIARAIRGTDGDSVLDHAWRTPGLEELVAIPLYLSVLLNQSSGVSLPTTKEALLRAFVTEHENNRKNAALLKQQLQGLHRRFLAALGAEAMRTKTTTFPDNIARAIVVRTQNELSFRQQIAQPFQPLKVLETLTGAHLLVGTPESGFTFQHQQFQEWFASLWVEELILASASGHQNSGKLLRQDVLDIPFWEEAILFACERLSRSGAGGARAVADLVVNALGIDPLLSAEIVHRSSDEAWALVKAQVVAFGAEWHTKRRVDRAVKFMIKTGRPEFAEYVWPLISDPSSQVHLRALRTRRFRAGVLGPDREQQIAALPEDVRRHVLAELVEVGDVVGINLAARLAKSDASASIQFAVVSALQFKRVHRFVAEILRSAPGEVWRDAARKWDAEDFGDPDVQIRIREEAAALRTDRSHPAASLRGILRKWIRKDGAADRVQDLVAAMDFSEKEEEQENGWAVRMTAKFYSEEVAAGLARQLADGRPVPYDAHDLVRSSRITEVEDGAIVERVLQSQKKDDGGEVAASIIGPKTAGILIDRLFALDARIAQTKGKERRALGEEYSRLCDLISHTRGATLARALVARASTTKPREIALSADLISRHGNTPERKTMELDREVRTELTETLRCWGEILLESPDVTRSHMAKIAEAAERLRCPSLVPILARLLVQDIQRRRTELEERKTVCAGQEDDAQIFWIGKYAQAFAAIGDDASVQLMRSYLADLEFGAEAAQALYAMWKNEQPSGKESVVHMSSPDFSVVKSRRASLEAGTSTGTIPFAEDIFSVAAQLSAADSAELQRHALNIAATGFLMPFSGKQELIGMLQALPRPAAEKRRLFTILALAGEVIPSQIVHQGLEELFDEAKSHPLVLQEDNPWRLTGWLQLFSFSDRPAAVLDALERLGERHKTPRALRGLLSALGNSSSEDAGKVLVAMAQRDPRFLAEHDWLVALTKQGTLLAAKALLASVCDGAAFAKVSRKGKRDIGRSLATFIRAHREFRTLVYDLYSTVTDKVASAIFECAIAEVPDIEGVLLLVRVAAGRKKAMRETTLYAALGPMLVGCRPSSSSPSTQVFFGMPATDLRKALFTLVINGTVEESKLASTCLVATDQSRDDYGYPGSEPRHPNISSGVPWPVVSKGHLFAAVQCAAAASQSNLRAIERSEKSE